MLKGSIKVVRTDRPVGRAAMRMPVASEEPFQAQNIPLIGPPMMIGRAASASRSRPRAGSRRA